MGDQVKCEPICPAIPHHEALDTCLNEYRLWHGTTKEVTDVVSTRGFDERVCNPLGLYGAGLYFACEACKAGQYAPATSDKHYFLYCRVLLGVPFYATAHLNHS